MNLVLAAQNATEPGVQEAVINSAGAAVGLVSLVLVAAWWAYFYR
ncbi:hypothetical protein [Halorientalis salina]|nr:hypothetical protein [Halorientalis salina]